MSSSIDFLVQCINQQIQGSPIKVGTVAIPDFLSREHVVFIVDPS